MKKPLPLLALLAGATLSGCMTVHTGEEVFAISAQKFILGKSMADAEEKIPEGATVLHVAHTRGPIFGLIQQSYIAGTR